jgi:hypothetical protein
LCVTPKSQENILACSIGDVAKNLGEMWDNPAVDDMQLYEQKARLKTNAERILLPTQLQDTLMH